MRELKTIIPYLRPYVRSIGVGLAMVVIANLFTIAGPYLMREAINALGDPDMTQARIGSYALLIVAAALLGGAARYGMREILNGISRRIECDLREDFFGYAISGIADFNIDLSLWLILAGPYDYIPLAIHSLGGIYDHIGKDLAELVVIALTYQHG